MTATQEQDAIDKAFAHYKETLGEVFGMRHLPGRRFRIFDALCYFAQGVTFYDRGVRLVIYEETSGSPRWTPFAVVQENELNSPAYKL